MWDVIFAIGSYVWKYGARVVALMKAWAFANAGRVQDLLRYNTPAGVALYIARLLGY